MSIYLQNILTIELLDVLVSAGCLCSLSTQTDRVSWVFYLQPIGAERGTQCPTVCRVGNPFSVLSCSNAAVVPCPSTRQDSGQAASSGFLPPQAATRRQQSHGASYVSSHRVCLARCRSLHPLGLLNA